MLITKRARGITLLMETRQKTVDQCNFTILLKRRKTAIECLCWFNSKSGSIYFALFILLPSNTFDSLLLLG